jgi:carbonic anhydrase
MSFTDELLENNKAYAATFSGPLPLPPAKNIAVLACMDARINVYGVLGLEEGQSHVIRNAGGVVTADEIRSLAISQRLLGTKEIILIHHTDFSDIASDVRQSIARIKASPFIPHTDAVRGFIFDVATGLLEEVK